VWRVKTKARSELFTNDVVDILFSCHRTVKDLIRTIFISLNRLQKKLFTEADKREKILSCLKELKEINFDISTN
jgi:hypothetical protein